MFQLLVNRVHFTPLYFSVDGVGDSEAASYFKRLAACLSSQGKDRFLM